MNARLKTAIKVALRTFARLRDPSKDGFVE